MSLKFKFHFQIVPLVTLFQHRSLSSSSNTKRCCEQSRQSHKAPNNSAIQDMAPPTLDNMCKGNVGGSKRSHEGHTLQVTRARFSHKLHHGESALLSFRWSSLFRSNVNSLTYLELILLSWCRTMLDIKLFVCP